MPTNIEYALMAGVAYRSTRNLTNRFPMPTASGWGEVLNSHRNLSDSGFEAIAFQRGTEIVISYAGTDPNNSSLLFSPDGKTNAALAGGYWADQLLQAAEYYLQIKATNPGATNITLTGHSLGGGLAALVGVFFGVQTTTFDQAPFAASALETQNSDGTWRSNAADLRARLAAKLDAGGQRLYDDTALAGLTEYLQLRDAGNGSFNNFIPRSGLVNTIRVEGEFLDGGFLGNSPIGNPAVPLSHGPADWFLSSFDLHSQALLAAFLQSNQSAASGGNPQQTLSEVTKKLTDLLKMFFDKNLFATDAATDKKNFFDHLVRHEAGVQGQFAADAMVTRFTSDLWKLANDGGMTMSDAASGTNWLSKALIAFAMQKYYDEKSSSIGVGESLFKDVTGQGGIQFDFTAIAASLDKTKDAQSTGYFKRFLESDLFTPAERTLINGILPILRDWYIQAGATALNTADTQNRNALLLGGVGSDGLVGGTGADLLIGNAGADLLQGKAGNDILLGGAGEDTYVYTPGDGLDTLLDTEGQNTLAVDGDILSGGAQYGDARVHRSSDGKHLYVRADANTLLIDGNLLIKNYGSGGSFGLTMTGAVADIDPQTTRTIKGDLTPIDTDPARQQPDGLVHEWTDDLGNLAVSTSPVPNRADTLYDGTGNERIESGGGNDRIYATRGGDNLIDAGSGRDMAYGGTGKDVLIGGTDGDILYGGAGSDRLYGETQTDVATAIAQGKAQTGSGQQGDWLAGAAGDDTLIGSAGNDVLSGGGGTDLLIGGAGDDDLFGDTDWVATDLTWSVGDQSDQRLFTPVVGTEFPADGAVDVIYAGAGNDHAWGGIGNDAIFGDGGDDSLAGEEGNDIILGGLGEDIIEGDGGNASDATAGNDYLDGGENNDNISGNGGDDIIIGGKGNDTIRGGAGRDTYIFNQGDGIDEIWDDDTGAEKSILIFGEGFDKNSIKLRTGSLLLDMGNGDAIHIENFDADHPLDTQSFASFQFADGSSLTWEDLLARGFDLDGTDGDDTLFGTGIEDRIDGKGGNDLIWAGDGNDVITGGTGTDGMNGGLGDDTYLFSAGDGATMDGTATGQVETLVEEGGTDTVRFAAGIDAQNLALTDNLDGSLLIDYAADGQPLDRLLIDHGLSGVIERIEVGAGGTARTLSTTQFIGEFGSGLYRGTDAANHLHLSGGKTDDSLYVAGGGNIVSGGRGNDDLQVYGTGNTILYSVGDGTDIVRTHNTANPDNILKLAGATADDLRLGLDAARKLVVQVGSNAADRMEFQRFDATDVFATRPIDSVEFDDGSTLGYDALMAKGFDLAGSDQADSLVGTSVADRIEAGAGNDWVWGYTGDDVLAGGSGNDVLIGGAGDDRYRFEAGDGLDVIQDSQGLNSVEFGAGLTAAGMSASQSMADDGQRYLDLDFGNGDRLSILDGELGRVDSFAFADGTVLNLNQVLALLPMVNLRGGDGNEVFTGFGGNDLIDGGAGNDVIAGGDGADRLYGGLGNDTLQGAAGADLLDGGAGDDSLAGGSGIDTYRFGAGMGQDTVIDTGGEASVLELMAGTNAFTLTARQEGDDLVLGARTGNDALRLTGYYAEPDAAAHWTVKTADGVVRDMSTFLQGIGEQVSTGSEFIAQFRQRWVAGWHAWQVNNGYTIDADGVARRSQSSMTTVGTSTVLRSETESVTFVSGDFSTGDGPDTYEVRYGFRYPYLGQKSFSWPGFGSSTVQSSVTTTSSVIREADLSRTALEPWDQPQPNVPTEPFFIPVYQQAQPVQIVGRQVPYGSTTQLVTDQIGRLRGIWIIPGASPIPPQPTEQTVSVRTEVVDIASVYATPISFLGAGDDAVAGLNLDGGSGNDLLAIDSDARYYNFGGKNLLVFLYGNERDDTLKAAGESEIDVYSETFLKQFLIGAAGDNVLAGDDISDAPLAANQHGKDMGVGNGTTQGVERIKSRRWRHGEGNAIRTAANDAVFEIRRKG